MREAVPMGALVLEATGRFLGHQVDSGNFAKLPGS